MIQHNLIKILTKHLIYILKIKLIVSDFLIKSSSLFNIDLEIKKSSKQFIDNNSRVITSDHESNLFVQNAISKKLFFLVEGQAEIYNESKNELLACINAVSYTHLTLPTSHCV